MLTTNKALKIMKSQLQKGALIEREAWLRKLSRELNKRGDGPVWNFAYYLRNWGKKRASRYNKRPGGLKS